MNHDFIYDIPVRIYFGVNQLSHLGEELKKYGKKVLLAYGGGSIKKTGLYDKVTAEMKKAGITVFELGGIDPNPRIDSVREGGKLCKKEKIDAVLAVGGGSTLDCAKYIAAAACYDGDPWDFFDQDVWAPIPRALPLVTVLTLSATGSEMDCGGVITNTETNDKIGRMEPALLPKVSFLDPSNTYTVSPYQTACGAADILSHIFEVYFSTDNDLYMLDCMAEGLIKTVIKYTPVAIKNPNDYDARANLMWASSWAINGFLNGCKKQAWSCHPMEHELSAFYDITHGLGLAILTPRWMRYTLDDTTLPKYKQFGINVFGIDPTLPDRKIAETAIDKLSEFLFETIGLKSTLSEIGITDEHFAVMAAKAERIGNTVNGFKPLKAADIEAIYRMCL